MFKHLALFLILLAGSLPAQEARTFINTARFSYFDSTVGREIEVSSKPVRVVAATGSAWEVSKTVSNLAPAVGAEVEFVLRALPTQTTVAFEARVDGAPRRLFVLRDRLPSGTSLVRVQSASAGAQVLFHRTGDPLHHYVTARPASLDAVAVGAPTLAPGASLALSLRVRVEGDQPFTNIAEVYSATDPGAPVFPVGSNAVTVRPLSGPPEISFFQSDFLTRLARSPIGAPLFVEAKAAFCNLATQLREEAEITLTSTQTGDREVFTGIETGADTGVFRITQPVPTSAGRAISGSGSLQTVLGDVIEATIDCGGGRTAKATIIITAAPGSAGLFARKTSSRDTAEIGDFVDYTIAVKNVSGSTLADVRVEDELPFGFKYVEGSAQLGARRLATAPAVHDQRVSFSLDTLEADATATLTYRARLGPGALQGSGENRAQALGGGFRSNVATARVLVRGGVFSDRGVVIGKLYVDANGNRLQDRGEDGLPGVRLWLEDGSYAITDSEGKYSFYGLTPRTHVVKVDATTLPAKAVLVPLDSRHAGRGTSRFIDLKRGEMQKADFALQPSPAVLAEIGRRRVAAEKAASEISGGAGYELTRQGSENGPSDPRSLPASGTFGAGTSALSGGQAPAREGFTNRGLPPASVGSISRDSTPSGFASGLQGSPFERVSGTGSAARAGNPAPKSAAAPGINLESASLHEPTRPQREGTFPYQAPPMPTAGSELPGNDVHADLFPTETRDEEYAATQTPVSALAPVTVAAALPVPAAPKPAPAASGNSLGFIDLREGDTLPSAQTNVTVQGKLGAALELRANGELVPAARVGRKTDDPAQQRTSAEFIGVELRPGRNVLEVAQRDPFGNVRGREQIAVNVPDKLGRIRISFPNPEAFADGRTATPVRVELVDERGTPVTTRTPLTLESSLGAWQVRDLDERTPGTQVFIEGGRVEYPLIAPIEPGDARLRVSSGALLAETTLPFLPELRDLLAVGLIEGRINFNKLGRGAIQPLRAGDAFERELREFSASSGNASAAARTAFFIKGRIKGSYLLTAAYDSDKDTKERLFRDIQPDEFYPVYGDSSAKGFDAQSTGKLYVRIDHRRSYLLYGDFTTQAPSDTRSLGNYSRSLTGVREHFENKRISANAWASYDTTRQIIEEFPGNGTSGPFQFRAANGLINSEKVEVLVRDRNQPALILQTIAKARFSDYEFEPFTGRLLFREPIPTLDENLNPVSIRVTYEVDQGGEKFWVYGADAQFKVNSRLELGGAAVRDENPLGAYALYSGNAVLDLGARTFLLGEWAQSDDATRGVGAAYRLELRHQSERLAGRIFYSRADAEFFNPAAILSSGRVEAGAQMTYKLGPQTRALLHALNSESLEGGARRGVLLGVEHAFSQRFRLEVGGRYSTETSEAASLSTALTPGATPNEVTSLRARLTLPVPFVENARVYGEYEQDITDADKRLAAFGGDYQLDEKTRLYARYEFLTSLGGPFELNSSQAHYSTVLGVDSAYAKNAALFNEYRVRDGIAGREAEGAIGLRNRWVLADGVRASTTVERVAPIKGVKEENVVRTESTAVTGAVEITTHPDWKGTARLEYRTSDTQDSWLNTLGYARKITDDFTFLARSILFLGISRAGETGDRKEARLQIGGAWRPVEVNDWNALGRYEYRYEDDATRTTEKLRRDVHVVSLDVNYQPTADWVLSAHYAGKYVLDRSGLSFHRDDATVVQLLSGRAIYEISKRWDAGLNVSGLLGGDAVQFGFGPEIGVRVADNVRLAVGYNVFGFRDEDLTESEYTDQGFYIALRMKFDETLLRRKDDEP